MGVFEQAALEYAALGYRVLPLRAGDKVPAIGDWVNRATTNPAQIADWWGSRSRANVGLATGRGFSVLDIDRRHGGEIPAWAPATLTVRTPTGGFHLYYAVSDYVPNSAGALALGVDVRGDGGQVAAPPSVRSEGSYEWVDSRVPIAHIDAELLIPTTLAGGRRGPGMQAYWDAIDADLETGRPVLVGRRNNYLVSLAGYHLHLGLGPENVLDEVQGEADRLGFTPDRPNEVVACVAGAATKHGHGSRRDLIERLRAHNHREH